MKEDAEDMLQTQIELVAPTVAKYPAAPTGYAVLSAADVAK